MLCFIKIVGYFTINFRLRRNWSKASPRQLICHLYSQVGPNYFKYDSTTCIKPVEKQSQSKEK